MFNETLGNAMLATTLCALCQCAYQQTLVETTPPLKPEYQPPHMPIATALDDESELERRAELEREEKVDKVSSFLFDAIASVVSATIFGSETDEEKREKLWRKSHKRKRQRETSNWNKKAIGPVLHHINSDQDTDC